MSSNNCTRGHLMMLEWFVASVTAAESPDRAEHAILGIILVGLFLADSGHICGRGANLRCRNPLLSRSNFTQGRLIKIEWLVPNVTAVGSPDRAERAILGVILAGRFLANSGQFGG